MLMIPKIHCILVTPQHPYYCGKDDIHYKPSEPNDRLIVNTTTHMCNTVKLKNVNINPKRHPAPHLLSNFTLREKMHHLFDSIPAHQAQQ